ncbi:Chitinase 1 [Podochytrium sp. JEL0797]|nr:Chitinase 1 [Podochytrium sp. JEL0797]
MIFTKLNSIALFAASIHVSALPTGRSSGKVAESACSNFGEWACDVTETDLLLCGYVYGQTGHTLAWHATGIPCNKILPVPEPNPAPQPEPVPPFPQPVVPGSVRDLIDESTFNKALIACGINQPDLYAGLTTGFTAPLSGMQELALLVGNTAHESGAYKFTEETACKGVTSVTNECPYGLYHGRGFIQLSWKANYEAAAKALGNPQILSNPDIVKNDMSVNWATVQWYWTDSVQPVFAKSGISLASSVMAINGPIECDSLGGKGIASQRVQYVQCFETQFLGYSSGPTWC